METKEKSYQKIAIILWAVVMVVAAATIGHWYGITGKKLIFPPVLALGVYLLMLNRLYGHFDKAGGSHKDDDFDFNNISSLESNQDIQPTSLSDQEPLSPEQKQEWLDDFLVKQQDK